MSLVPLQDPLGDMLAAVIDDGLDGTQSWEARATHKEMDPDVASVAGEEEKAEEASEERKAEEASEALIKAFNEGKLDNQQVYKNSYFEAKGGKLGNQRGDFEKAGSKQRGILKKPVAKTATAMKGVLKRPSAAVSISPKVVKVSISPKVVKVTIPAKAPQALLKKPSASVKTVGAQRDEDEEITDIGEDKEEEEEGDQTEDEINEEEE